MVRHIHSEPVCVSSSRARLFLILEAECAEDEPAYTLHEFRDFYGSLANARWHWMRSQPANPEEHLQSVDVDEESILPTLCSASQADGSSSSSSSAIELVLHADPPARVAPETAGEMLAVMEVCT